MGGGGCLFEGKGCANGPLLWWVVIFFSHTSRSDDYVAVVAACSNSNQAHSHSHASVSY